jgi:hypothetical protein
MMKKRGLLSALLGMVAVCGLCANVYAADATAMTGMDAAAKATDAKAADAKAADAKAADAKAADAKAADVKAADAKATDANAKAADANAKAADANAKAADANAKATDANAKATDAKPAVAAEPKDPLDGIFIAGTAPSQRPAGAPTIKEMKKDKAWYDKAVTGVSRPFPWSLKFLESQGNWYTPFTRAGMVGRYDIRGWHNG